MLLLVVIGFFSCDNEIDLNAEFEDTTVIFSLLDAGSDTQFVRVSKAFLKDGSSALDLAKDPSNLYYDSLLVKLINVDSKQEFILSEIDRAKQPGIFSTQGNRVYFTTETLTVGTKYRLEVMQPEGKVSSSTTQTLSFAILSKPRLSSEGRQVTFVNNVNEKLDYDFQFDINRSIAKFEARLYFLYKEEVNGNLIPRQVEMPIGSYSNGNLEDLRDLEITFPANRFFQTIAQKVEPTSTRKEVPLKDNLLIEVFAADEQFIFYQDLNGPIDGIAQVRPEYTNIVNGIGLFASRSSISYFAFLNDFSRTELKSGDLTGNHNFVDP